MDNISKNFLKALNANLPSAVQATVKKSCLVDFGIVKEIVADGIVKVLISVAERNEDIKVITCVYANPASSNLALKIVPKVNDKVIVFYSRYFNPSMFSLEEKEAIVDSYGEGYNMYSGIAIPLNQFKNSSYHRYLKADKDKLTLALGYDKSTKENKFVAEVDENGNVNLTVGDISLEDGNGNKVESSSSGIEVTDKFGNVITTDSTGVHIQPATGNKFEVKNSTSDLATILKDILSVLQGLVTPMTITSPTGSCVYANAGTDLPKIVEDITKLNLLM